MCGNFFGKSVSVAEFRLPKDGQIHDCNIPFLRVKSDLQLGNRQFTTKLHFLANISSNVIHKHSCFESTGLHIDFALCPAIFGLFPVTALDSDLSEDLRKIDLRKFLLIIMGGVTHKQNN